MLLFAVWRPKAVGDAQPARAAHGRRGPVALWSPQPILPYCFFTICGGLARTATRNCATWEAQCPVAHSSSGSNEVLATHKAFCGAQPLNRSPRRLELSKSLLGIHSSFDGAVVLLDDVIQVLHRPVPATTAESPFLLNSGDRRAVDRRQIGIDDTRLRMRGHTQSFAKQPFGRVRITQSR